MGKETLMPIVKATRHYNDEFPAGKTDIATMPLMAYDIESTGPNPTEARIVQAAIVIDIPGEERVVWSWLVNPDMDIPLEASAVHGISTENARENGIDTTEALFHILESLQIAKNLYGVRAVCAFNSVFDFTILDGEMRRNGLGKLVMDDIGIPIIDPLICDRKLDTYRSGRRTLTAVSSAYRVVVSGAHRADGDCITTLKLTRAMAEKYPRFRHANLDRLQVLQALAQSEFARQFQEYRRQDDPTFCVSGDWPILQSPPNSLPTGQGPTINSPYSEG
jgi:DNA polymerase-3 subunit epsilon